MQLYIIRHGESANNALSAAEAANRVSDPPLTERGETQARKLADHLVLPAGPPPPSGASFDLQNRSGYRFTKLFCSPMIRALKTITPIAEVLGMSPEVWVDVHEQGGIYLEGSPDLPGLKRNEMESRFPGFVLPEGLKETGWWNRPQESETELVARSARVARELEDRFASTEERIAIVTHGGFGNCLLHALVNSEPDPGTYFRHQNTAISRVDFEEDRVNVCYLNRVDHLPTELVT